MKTVLIGVAALFCAVSTASADVQVSMQNGRVSLVAKDVTVRQILTEWARVGQTKIVNVEKLPGGPITLELNNVPEAQALEVLLRSLSGYITAPRPVDAENLSHFDRIIIMPTLVSARPAVASAPPPVYQPQQFQPPQPVEDDQEDRPAPNMPAPNPQQQRGPVFNTFPQPQVVNPQGVPPQQQQQPVTPPVPMASPMPVAPYGGVAVPGMVAPPPPAPPGGQSVTRRPGGR